MINFHVAFVAHNVPETDEPMANQILTATPNCDNADQPDLTLAIAAIPAQTPTRIRAQPTITSPRLAELAAGPFLNPGELLNANDDDDDLLNMSVNTTESVNKYFNDLVLDTGTNLVVSAMSKNTVIDIFKK